MIYRLAAIAAAPLLAAMPAAAQEEPPKPVTVSGNVALVSDYRFRGVSQSDKEVALQGGATVTHESGVYAGAWASISPAGARSAAPIWNSTSMPGSRSRSPAARRSTSA